MHYGDEVRLTGDALHIANRPRGVTRYLLQPPENLRSDILLEARLRVAGPPGVPLATLHVSRVSFRVLVLRDAIWWRLPAAAGEQRQPRLPQLHQRPAGGRGACGGHDRVPHGAGPGHGRPHVG